MSNSNKLQNKKSKIKQEEEEREIKRDAKVQAKMEAERKAQSITQQAKHKARAEAERRTIEITQQAEHKARAEAEVIKQSRQIMTTTNDSYPQVESKNFEVNRSNNNGFFYPFMKSVSMWQNYSMFWMNLTKEILSNSTRITNDFENTIRKYRPHQTFD